MRKIKLPEAALDFIVQEMSNAPPLFERSLATILQTDRSVSTYLPDELVLSGAQLLDFRASILPPLDPSIYLDFDDANGGAWQAFSAVSLDGVLVALMRRYLLDGPRRLVIFNDPIPDRVLTPRDFELLRIARFGDALHYFVTADDLDSEERMIEPFDHARFIHWQTIGVFVNGFDHGITEIETTLSEDVVSDLAFHADVLVVGAYDMEGFLMLGELPE